MWIRLMGIALLFTPAACAMNRGEETGRATTDTVVTTQEVVDTALVTTDTTITVDTTKIEGDAEESPSIQVDTTSAQ